MIGDILLLSCGQKQNVPLSAGAVCQTRFVRPRSVSDARKEIAPPEGRGFVFSVAERTGLEPATPGVTGRYSNQLNYRSRGWWALQGSNLRPSPCKGDALPAELSARERRASLRHLSGLCQP